MTRIILFLFSILVLQVSCKNREPENKTQPNQQEALMRINKYLVKKDADAIKGYISRHGWNMHETKAGLWYEITAHGNGAKAETGKTATLEYKVWLLNGKLCYSSDSLGNKSFPIGKGGVEPGLELGILMLREGDKARFIMPPHLAHGLIGDEDKIPARASIIYEVHLLKISDPK
jgi:FKBP-type peptidyl-prolyl cis-trans isomerase